MSGGQTTTSLWAATSSTPASVARTARQLRTVANRWFAPPSPTAATKDSAAFRNAAAPHPLEPTASRDTTTSNNGPILPGSKPVSADGETDIDLTPTGNLKDNDLREYRVVLGIDKNSDGQLTNDEVVMNDAPLSQRFYIKAVTQADYQDSMDFLDWRDNWGILYPAATDFVRYFDGNDSTLAGGTPLPPKTVAITTAANPTHIAGSPYNPTNGDAIKLP